MGEVTRLVTHVELYERASDGRNASVSARLEAVLADGRTQTLLDDRGWGWTGPAGIVPWTSVEELEQEARMVVGPDEPRDGETYEQSEAAHWGFLAGVLGRHGANTDARELASLPHDVVLGRRLREWIHDRQGFRPARP